MFRKKTKARSIRHCLIVKSRVPMNVAFLRGVAITIFLNIFRPFFRSVEFLSKNIVLYLLQSSPFIKIYMNREPFLSFY